MASIRAAIMPGGGAPVEVREIPEPELEPGSALLRVELSEVCGTDVHLSHSRLAGVPYPIIPGHVSAGVLEKIRGDLRDVEDRPLEEGQRVTFLDVHKTCHACWHCLVAKASTRCPKRKVYGITYGLGDGLTGGWAEAIYLKPGVRCLPLDDLSGERFMAGGCALPTSLHAIDRADIRLGDTVLVLGSGPVGLSAVAFAALSGAGRVYCIGAPNDRLAVARAMGADDVLDFTAHSVEERMEWVRERTEGRGVDIAIEAAGAPDAPAQAMRMTRDAGRVVVVGQYTDHGAVEYNPHLDINKKHLEVRGCWGSDFSHFHRGIRALQSPRLGKAWDALKLERFGLDQANEALDRVARGTIIKALIEPGL